MKAFKEPSTRTRDWLVAAVLSVVAAAVYFISMADYAFPGEGAHLMAVWSGLDEVAASPHPVMAFFAKALGCGNVLAPICGVIIIAATYLLTAFFIRERINGEMIYHHADWASMLAGLTTAVILIFTPAMRSASTHLSSASFVAAWAMLTALPFIGYARAPKPLAPVYPVVIGVMTGLGLVDSPYFVFLAPGYLTGVWVTSCKRGGKGYGAAIAMTIIAIITFFSTLPFVSTEFTAFLRDNWTELRSWLRLEGSMFIAFFAVLPFVLALFSSYKAFNMQSDLSQWLYHLAMSIVAILAISTPLSPSALMKPYGELPVLASIAAAFTAGYLITYWMLLSVAKVKFNESKDKPPAALKGRPIALVALPVLALVFAFTVMLDIFSFDGDRGAFADRTAAKILDDLDGRTWFVTDGTLDDHLRLEAARRGQELNLVCLQRDLDERYLEALAKVVRDRNLGGENTHELELSLALGVLPFVQDWFSSDPEIGDKVAIFGAPDLWYSAGIKPIPEFLFFGADENRSGDWAAWKEFNEILSAPPGWGSYRLWEVSDPVELMRLGLRRHIGLIANDCGVLMQDMKDDDEAFRMYELVLNEIDADNVCSLFNEFELARIGQADAVAKKKELEKSLKTIVDDKDRRYVLWKLASSYGYIRSPEIFVRLGFSWARSGRPGDALNQIRRAIDFVPTDKRTNLLNMMAALYASDNDSRKSREMYRDILETDAGNHDALIGMMRLELMEGNSEKALEYLSKAAEVSGDDPRAKIEKAMLHMMKNELKEAKTMLTALTEEEGANMQAWSLLAAVTIQQVDAAANADEKRALTKELEESILPQMEKHTNNPFDYYVQTTKAFILMRQGQEKRREARDAFVAAAKERPDVQATQDLVLGLDISLNDTAGAEKHAREVLRRNRKAPLANYVMGSLALQKGDYSDAEAYLRRSADAPRPVSLAQNDLAEVYRRTKRMKEAEKYARLAIKTDPNLYVAYETLGAVLMDADGDLDEAEQMVLKACELSKGENGREEDIRMLISLARVQIRRGDMQRGRTTLRKVQSRVKELSDFERSEFEDLQKSVK